MSKTMKAIVKEKPGPGLTMTEVPVPVPGPGEVLIKVKTVSICGTDYHIYSWDRWAQSRIKPPLIVGHELAGHVVQLGQGVNCLNEGDFVSAECHIVCAQCTQCSLGQAHVCANTTIIGVDVPGCFAEYMVMPEANVWVNAPDLPAEWASVQDPLGNAIHSVLSGEIVGKTVAVLGAGPIGLMSIQVARATGAAAVAVSEVNSYRMDMARRLGADLVVDPTRQDPVARVRELFPGGADVVLEMAGHPDAVTQSLKMVRAGGRVSMLGIPAQDISIDVANDIVFKGIEIHGIAGRQMWRTWHQMAGLLRSGLVDLDQIITHRMPWEEFDRGMKLMGEGTSGKIVLTVTGE